MSLIGQTIGNYRIISKLGEGGMGAVYLGEHPLIGKKVAIKILLQEWTKKEDIVRRFFTEAKSVNDIGHEHIVDIIDFGKTKFNEDEGEIVYFIMELLVGESLSSRLRKEGLTISQTLSITKQICSALQASHDKGIVHRDLKPDNIYLCTRSGSRDFVKVLDFGIAKLTGEGGQETRAGVLLGTPSYMSPEQCQARGQIDHRSDIYSLGALLFTMLAGRPPFVGDMREILVSHILHAPPRPSDIKSQITPELDVIVLHALEKVKEQRFQSMAEFSAALADPAAHCSVSRNTSQDTYTPIIIKESSHRPAEDGEQTPVTAISLQPLEPATTTLSDSIVELTNAPQPSRRGKFRAPVLLGILGCMAILVLGVISSLARGRMSHKASPLVSATANSKREPSPSTKPLPPAPLPSEPSEPPHPQPPQPSSSLPEVHVAINLISVPIGVRVRRDSDHALLGVTPIKLQEKRDAPGYVVRLELDGYVPLKKKISFTRDTAMLVTLDKKRIKKTKTKAVPTAGEEDLLPLGK